MKTLKFFSFLLGVFLLEISSSYAAQVTQGTITSPELTCNDGSYAISNEQWYVGDTLYPRDVFYGGSGYDWIFGTVSTRVDVYNPTNALQINGGFDWYSQGKPAGVDRVTVFQNYAGSKLVSHPASPDTLAAQIVYRTARKYSNTFAGGSYSLMYTPVGAATTTHNYVSKPTYDSSVTIKNECVNIYARWCGDGLVTNNETCDPAAPGQSSATCDPVTCKPITKNPVCSSTLSGTLSTPITAGQCDVGTPGNFKDVVSADGTHTYTWVCTSGGVDFSPGTYDSCSANYKPATTDLTIKKYVKSITTTGDSESVPVQVSLGETFNYYYVFENTNNIAINNVVIKDTFPEYLSYTGNIKVTNPSGVDVTSDWTINKTTYNGTSRIALVMTKKTALPANSGKYTVTIPVTLSANAPLGTSMRNVAYICGDGTTAVTGPNGETICGTTNPPPPPPPNCTPENNPHKDPACIIVEKPDLIIKKAVKGQDAQTAASVVNIGSGETYQYTFTVTNTGTTSVAGAKVVDTMPSAIEIVGTPTGTDWTCTVSGQTLTCLYDKTITAGMTLPVITVSAKIRPTAPEGVPIRNVAAVCVRDPSMPTSQGGDCTPDPASCQPGNVDYDPATGKCDPATVITGGFDLSLKKYIGSVSSATDYNTSTLSTTTNASLNYQIVVTNNGSGSTTGVSTVQDILPTGVTFTGATSWTNGSWSCAYTSTGTTVTCTSSQVVVAGANYDTIIVPIIVTATSGQSVTNIAAVDNPNEVNRCNADGTMPASASASCTKDPKNSDPAILSIPGNGGGGGTYWYTPKCVNNIYTCETTAASQQPSGSYGTLELCKSALGGTYGASCGGGGGNGGGGGSYCGDGVLQAGEECDVRGAAWCDSQCKITFTTNPGDNPVMSLSIKIPGLATIGSATFGASRPFNEYRVVVGQGTPVFTLADTVAMDIRTEFKIPVMIPADRLFCLSSSDNNAIGAQTLCNPISRYITPTTINGQNYVVLGSGDYQVRQSDGTYTLASVTNPTNSVALFKGFDISQTSPLSTNLSLRDAFVGIAGTPGALSNVTLYNRDPIVDPTGTIDLATFQVRLSSAIVGTTGTPVNRSIESFVRATPASIVNNFLGNVSTTTTTSTTTNSTASMGNIAVSGAMVGNVTVKSLAELEQYALNGNKNILAIKGNLTVDNCLNSTFNMQGIRTVIVEGNITFKCNTAYSDTASSWAWIAKDGNIIIDNGDGTVYKKGITNLAGVYVTIGNTTTTGQFVPLDSKTTTAILKVDGSLYGNANPLFNSRLYARGTSAYDILTAGTIITYSNRALINPPPLLSQYLSNYNVERVVK